jgi:hypothetical protein
MADHTSKLEQAQQLIAEYLSDITSTRQKSKKPYATKSSVIEQAGDKNYIIQVINKVKNCKESDSIEKNILDKNSAAGKILLPFYICSKYFPTLSLTTGDVEKITAELGVRIDISNVGKAIRKSLLKYLDSNTTRTHGVPTNYKINRKGIKYFEGLLNN